MAGGECRQVTEMTDSLVQGEGRWREDSSGEVKWTAMCEDEATEERTVKGETLLLWLTCSTFSVLLPFQSFRTSQESSPVSRHFPFKSSSSSPSLLIVQLLSCIPSVIPLSHSRLRCSVLWLSHSLHR